MPKVFFNSDGVVQIYDPVSNTTTSTSLNNAAGSAKCPKKDPTECTITSISMMDSEDGDFGASFGMSSAIANKQSIAGRLISNLYTGIRNYIKPEYNFDEQDGEDLYVGPEDKSIFGDDLPWSTSSPSTRGRGLQNTLASDETNREAYISNPVICTDIGSALLFSDLGPNKYPIYLKDSLLNTNDRFDYGEFLKLPDLLSNGTIKAFWFTFAESGVYVFGDSRN